MSATGEVLWGSDDPSSGGRSQSNRWVYALAGGVVAGAVVDAEAVVAEEIAQFALVGHAADAELLGVVEAVVARVVVGLVVVARIAEVPTYPGF